MSDAGDAFRPHADPDRGPDPGLARLARLVRQQLEIDRMFGWEVPLRRSQLLCAASPPVERPAPPRAPAAPLVPDIPDIPDIPGPTGAPGADPASRLAPLAAAVASCTRCDLCRSRTNTVFGTGNPAARLFFVGEGPGADEDLRGEPFVGAAGQLLDRIIAAMGLAREDVYIANIVKCRPPENRAPHPGEVGACLPYLEEQIAIVAPEILVALGATAARTLLGSELSIGRLRGRFHEYRGIPLMPTYHPAYLLRNPADKRKVWEDIQLVMRRLDLDA